MRDAERICIPYLYALRIILSLYRLEWGWGLGIHTFISYVHFVQHDAWREGGLEICKHLNVPRFHPHLCCLHQSFDASSSYDARVTQLIVD